MELKHSFTVPVSLDRAWDVLLDVERVATCMPGATLDSVDGDDITGKIKVKVGPITQVYAGKAHFTERDAAARVVTLEASGKETRGAGTASATVRSELVADGDNATAVTVVTNLNVTGKAAQFGRGVLSEVSGKLVGIFAGNLASMLAAEEAPRSGASGAGAGAAEAAGASGAAGAVSRDGDAGVADPASLAKPIEELGLPIRACNTLRREGVHTVADLAARTPQQLLAMDHIGPASLDEIRQRLADSGLALAEPDADSKSAEALGAAAGAEAASANGSGATPATPAAFPASSADASAADGAAGSGDAAGAAAGSGAAAGVAGSGATPAPPLQSAPAQAPPAWKPDNEAVDLLSVAGMPVLKRAIPVAAGLVALAFAALFRRRRRRARR